MSLSVDTTSLIEQVKDAASSVVSTVKEAVVGEPAPIDDKHRVFVGNLSIETTADDVKSMFSEAGEVYATVLSLSNLANNAASATPSGIAFVGYVSDADATNAVEKFNGKTLGERDINVAIARPISERKPRAKKDSNNAQTGQENAQPTQSTAETTASAATKSSKVPKKKRAQKPKAAAQASETKILDGEIAQTADTAKPAETVSSPETVKSAETTQKETALPDAAAKTSPVKKERIRRTSRGFRARGLPANGVPSPVTLFVAGLDAKTTDAELKELFASYNPISVHVVLRPIPRYLIKVLAEKGEQRLGRGYGFVTFADTEAQTAALTAMNGQKFGEKELAVKIAIDDPKQAETKDVQQSTTDAEPAPVVSEADPAGAIEANSATSA